MTKQIAALFVQTNGCYFNLPCVDPWDEARDARLYDGTYPVVAHPPCQRWGRYWGGGPMLHGTPKQKVLGDDKGCFSSALASVRRWGGVLEHPEASHAWEAQGLQKPPRKGGWIPAGDGLGFTCCVAQGNYGHKARKLTWLYSVNCILPELNWTHPVCQIKCEDGFHSAAELARLRKTGICQRLSARQLAASPEGFRDLLIHMARSSAAR